MTLSDTLYEVFEETRRRAPHIDARGLSRLLDVSEGELQAARLGRGVDTLSMTACDLVMLLPKLGPVEMTSHAPHAALASRLDVCRVSTDTQQAGVGDGHALAMKLLLPCWYWVALSCEESPDDAGALPCVQIFDRFGRRLHRLRLLAPSRSRRTLLNLYRSNHPPGFTRCIETVSEPGVSAPPDLLKRWRTMRCEADHEALLRRYRLSRLGACQALSGHFSQRLEKERFLMALARRCRAQRQSAASLIHSAGAHHHRASFEYFHQTREGIVRLESESLTLSLESAALDQVWQVTRPGSPGLATRLEAFDHHGRLMASLGA